MPYTVVKQGDRYVIKKKSGKTVAGHKTKLSKSGALAAMRARYAHEKKR
jgi:hypothetical protein